MIFLIYAVLIWELFKTKAQLEADIIFSDLSSDHLLQSDEQYQPTRRSKASQRISASWSLFEKQVVEEIKSQRMKRKLHTVPNLTHHDHMDVNLYRERVKPFGFHFLKLEDSTFIQDQASSKMFDTATTTINSGDYTHCGIEARSAFLDRPLSFPLTKGINEDSTILITGILSRLGFHLALKLATHCKVKLMVGVDPLYPNDPASRLEGIEQIKILYKQVPHLKKPLLVSFEGINPKQYHRSVKSYFFNEKTGDLDFVGYANPTHIIHVLSSERNSYRKYDRSADDENNGLFLLRQSMIAMEQLLTNLSPSSQVHFTFISNVGVLNKIQHKPIENRDLFETTKLMEEVLLHFYSKRLTSYSFVILRIPTLYGPWGQPGAFDYDVAQNAIKIWNTYHSDKHEVDVDLSSPLILHDKLGQIEKPILYVDGK